MTDELTEQKQRWMFLQEQLAAQVECPPEGGYQPRADDVLLGLDIQYEGDRAYVAGDLSYVGGEHIETYAGEFAVSAPYISGFFCFREGPPVLALLTALEAAGAPTPQILLVDGHGLAHPRRFGAACWIGVATGIPTLGCAKDTLVRYEGELAGPRGSRVPVTLPCEGAARSDEQVVGYVLRRIDEVRPVYVSPGHLLSLETACELALALPSKYRIPDPIRRADRAARELSRAEHNEKWRPLGALPPTPASWEKR